MSSFLTISRRCLTLWLILVTEFTLAQEQVPNQVPQGPTITSGRSYYFEIGLVLVMFGAALFAVCRSSSRR